MSKRLDWLAIGTVPVAVIVVAIEKAGLVSSGVLADGTQELIGLLSGAGLVGEGFVEGLSSSGISNAINEKTPQN